MHRVLIALYAAAAGACGSAAMPVGPTSRPASDLLLPGAYHLSITGYDASGTASEPGCQPVGLPPAGKIVSADLALQRDGLEWVARLVGADADLELRVRDEGPVASGRRVSGVLRGWMTDRGTETGKATGVVARVHATAAGDFAVLDGEVPALLPSSVFATAEGSIVFSDAQGRAATCPSVQIALGRAAASAQPLP